MSEIFCNDMRAISLKQPWLYAITHLGKRIENRTWRPPAFMISRRIALHASGRKDQREWVAAEKIHGSEIPQILPFGAIVATAVITDWFTKESQTKEMWWPEQEKWFFGPHGWVFDAVHVLDEPLPCKGKLGLWRIPDDIEGQIKYQLMRDDIVKASI